MRKKISKLFVTVFYLGKIKYASGTFGSLAAFPLCYIVMHFTLSYQLLFPIDGVDIAARQFITLIIMELLATLLLFFLGLYYTSCYIKGSEQQDPKEVVIDEVVGQMLTIILNSFSVAFIFSTKLSEYVDVDMINFLFLFLFPFILFRVFDIFKPWPINWLDQNIKGAFGVMLDDIAASIFAVVVNYTILFFILDFYS